MQELKLTWDDLLIQNVAPADLGTRQLAASLEGVPVSALALAALREHDEHRSQETQDAVLRQVGISLAAADRLRTQPLGERVARAQRLMDVEKANDLLLETFMPFTFAGPTRAWPLRGGLAQWIAEVSQELEIQGIRDSSLLEGLSRARVG